MLVKYSKWICAAALISMALIGITFFAILNQTYNRVSIRWHGEQMHMLSSRNGFVVTHLVCLSKHSSAALPKPELYLDSSGPQFDIAYLRQLPWVDAFNRPAPPPEVGDKMSVVFYRPTFSEVSQ